MFRTVLLHKKAQGEFSVLLDQRPAVSYIVVSLDVHFTGGDCDLSVRKDIPQVETAHGTAERDEGSFGRFCGDLFHLNA